MPLLMYGTNLYFEVKGKEKPKNIYYKYVTFEMKMKIK